MMMVEKMFYKQIHNILGNNFQKEKIPGKFNFNISAYIFYAYSEASSKKCDNIFRM